jgi:hypothetical protein
LCDGMLENVLVAMLIMTIKRHLMIVLVFA